MLFISILSGILNSAQASLDDAVTLKECDSIDLTRISSPNDYIAAASSSETLEQIEEVVTAWIKQIEQVLCIKTLLVIMIIKQHDVLLINLKGSGRCFFLCSYMEDITRWMLSLLQIAVSH